jgi:hypothetical protein
VRTLDAALEVFARVGRCWVATSGADGSPHLATANGMERRPGEPAGLTVSYWFCPRTVENLEHNTRVSITVWDPAVDQGYQLVGAVRRVEDRAWLDGFDAREEPDASYPSVERALVVEVAEVLAFRHAPHGDEVIEESVGKPAS